VAQSNLSIDLIMERGAVEVAGAVKKPTSFAGGLFCYSAVTSYPLSCAVFDFGDW
jgi:hypothetical protein